MRVDPLAVVAPRLFEEISRTSTVIAVFLSWDERRREFVRDLRDRGVEVKVIVVAPGQPDAGALAATPGARWHTIAEVQRGIDSL